jgi:hypothetical protein
MDENSPGQYNAHDFQVRPNEGIPVRAISIIERQTGIKVDTRGGKQAQLHDNKVSVVFELQSGVSGARGYSRHVLVGARVNGKDIFYNPQTGTSHPSSAAGGSFVSYPVDFNRVITQSEIVKWVQSGGFL